MAFNKKILSQTLLFVCLPCLAFTQDLNPFFKFKHGVAVEFVSQPTIFHDLKIRTVDNYGYKLEAFWLQTIQSKLYFSVAIQAGRECSNIYYKSKKYVANTYNAGLPIQFYYRLFQKPMFITSGLTYLHVANDKLNPIQLPSNIISISSGICYSINTKQNSLITEIKYSGSLNKINADFDLPDLKTSFNASKSGLSISVKFIRNFSFL